MTPESGNPLSTIVFSRSCQNERARTCLYSERIIAAVSHHLVDDLNVQDVLEGDLSLWLMFITWDLQTTIKIECGFIQGEPTSDSSSKHPPFLSQNPLLQLMKTMVGETIRAIHGDAANWRGTREWFCFLIVIMICFVVGFGSWRKG